jgi:hypothetical protein
METALYYTFSTTAQVLGAFLALGGVFVVFKMQSIYNTLLSEAGNFVHLYRSDMQFVNGNHLGGIENALEKKDIPSIVVHINKYILPDNVLPHHGHSSTLIEKADLIDSIIKYRQTIIHLAVIALVIGVYTILHSVVVLILVPVIVTSWGLIILVVSLGLLGLISSIIISARVIILSLTKYYTH